MPLSEIPPWRGWTGATAGRGGRRDGTTMTEDPWRNERGSTEVEVAGTRKRRRMGCGRRCKGLVLRTLIFGLLAMSCEGGEGVGLVPSPLHAGANAMPEACVRPSRALSPGGGGGAGRDPSEQSCRSCGRSGHNTRTCTLRGGSTSDGTSSSSSSSGEDTPAPEPPICGACSLKIATHGCARSEAEGLWEEFYCRQCARKHGGVSKPENSGQRAPEPLYGKCNMCRRMAFFGERNTGRRGAQRCRRHREAGQVNLISRMCVRGCGSRASFGDAVERTLMFCKNHKGPLDIDLLHRRCAASDCSRVPTFGAAGSVPRHCAAHRGDGEVDVLNKKCCYLEGCTAQRRFGDSHAGAKGAIYCASHKCESHRNLVDRKCTAAEGCFKLPIFGDAIDGVPLFCAAHKMPDHVDVVNREKRRRKARRTSVDAARIPLLGDASETGSLSDGETDAAGVSMGDALTVGLEMDQASYAMHEASQALKCNKAEPAVAGIPVPLHV